MIGDTIAALSTPVGEGGIGIVRLSGPRSVPIVDRLFRPADAVALPDVPTHTIRYGHIVSDGRTLDEVLVAVMRAPRSYTREDVVEIDCHGGIVATRAILDAVLGAGARLAEPGEFTRRAFLNGRISLDQAQAVLDVVRAKTRLGLEAAIDRLDGRFSSEIGEIRAGIAGLLADLEVGIDFPDFDVDPLRILDPLERIEERVSDLLRLAEDGMRVREGLTVAIAGRPNVGKSTLLNALLAERRAIVTPIDTVEGETAIDGVPVRLIDTAGLRDPADPVEAEGVLRAREAVRRSDLLLLVLDRNEPLTDQDRSLLAEEWGIPVLVVADRPVAGRGVGGEYRRLGRTRGWDRSAPRADRRAPPRREGSGPEYDPPPRHVGAGPPPPARGCPLAGDQGDKGGFIHRHGRRGAPERIPDER